MRYLLANNVRFVPVAKTGSAMLSHAIFKTHHLTDYNRVLSGLHKPAGLELSDVFFQGICPHETEPTAPVVIALRDPVERFRSACAFLAKNGKAKTVDEWLDIVDDGKADQHFDFQHKKVLDGFALYQFPDHLDQLKTVLGLDETWIANASAPETKPDLTPEQLARVQAIYADDIALYESITVAGQVYVKPVDLAALEAELESSRSRLVEAARLKRQQVEQGGFQFNGMTIPSDRESQAMINGAFSSAKDDPTFTTPWQVTPTSFITLDSPTIISMGQALRDHVRDSFSAQAAKVAEITAATTMAELEALSEN